MELKDLAKDLGCEVSDEATPEEIEELIKNKLKEKDTQIQTLESEKDALSKDKEELVSSVEGHKTNEENLSKELSETKTKLSVAEGQLSQITELYKESFTKDPEKDVKVKEDKKLSEDVLDKIIGVN